MLKHIDNLDSKEKVKYDLYKILRMSILLNQKEADKITLDKFKEVSLNIDNMLGETYDEKIETMFYDTSTLEEEENRLKNLVALIKERVENRKNLLEDYRSVTNRELNDLEYINKSGDLDLFENRLNTIKEYLDNSRLIKVNEIELEQIKDKLIKEYDIKSSNEMKNIKLEEILLSAFKDYLYETELYTSLESANIEKEIEKIQREIKETQEQKETFEQAFENLKLSGISGELELEYASFVENAKKNYYETKEQEIILKLYKLINEKESEYSNIFKKREEVKDLLEERMLLRKELNVKEKDLLSGVYEIIKEQKKEIESEKENAEGINILSERIKLKENRLEELRRVVTKPEILSILKEYGLIETYDHEDEISDEIDEEKLLLDEEKEEQNDNGLGLLNDLLADIKNDEIKESFIPKEENIVNFAELAKEQPKEYLPNQIKESLIVPTMNFGLSRLKSISVMKRVGDMLGINAKSFEVKQEEKAEIKQEPTIDLFVETDTKAPIFIDSTLETPKEDDLFWTQNEYEDIKEDIEKNEDSEENVVITDNNVSEESQQETEEKDMLIFDFETPKDNVEEKEMLSLDFETSNDNKTTDKEVLEFDFEKFKDNNQIYEEESSNNGLIFPEPVMPELNVLPENKEDKFMWPDNMETFDINGIFPN